MKGKIILILFFVFGVSFGHFSFRVGSTLSAQNVPKFNKTYSVIGNLPNTSTSIMSCSGGYVIYGETKDSNNLMKVSIIKIDTLGNLIWAKSFGRKDSNYWSIFTHGGGGASIPWGGYIGVGYIGNDTGSWGTWDKLALFRFDNNGDTIWTKIYSDTARLEGWFVKVARNNRYILGCNWFEQKTTYFYTPALTLTDSFGNRIWQKTYHAAPNHVRFLYGIDTCKDGGYVICADEMDTNNPGAEAENIVIIKTDTIGDPQWTRFITPPYYNIEGENILSLKNGGYIVCGTQGTKKKWPKNYPLLFMTKLNDTGGTVWGNTYGNPAPPLDGSAYLFTSRELPNGDIIACGFELDTLNTIIRGCILKVDSNGNQKWLRYYYKGTPSAQQDYLWDILPTTDEGYVSCGTMIGSTESTWVIKTDSMGCDTIGCNYMGMEQVKVNRLEVEVFPNPSTGRFTIAFVGTQNVEHGTVEIYNILGERVYASNYSLFTNHYSLDLSNQPNGVYFYRVVNNDGSVLGSGKLIIQK